MKGLYFQQSSTNEEITFVFQERENLPITEDNYVKLQVKACALSQINTKLLAEMKMEKEFFPVGREVAGIVLDVGSKVSFFQPDDEVVGILPLDSEDPGLCEAVRVHEHYLVHKPEKVTWTEAAGTIRDGLRVYTALHYLSHLSPGKSVLIMDGASALGTIAIQLAHHRGAKVISTACSLEDKQFLERFRPPIARVIDVSNGKAHVAESCLEETGGLGVDIVLDAGDLSWMNPFHYTRQKLPWKLFRKIKEERSKLFSFNVLSDLSWMNQFQYLKPELPWKLFIKVKEPKSKFCVFKYIFLLKQDAHLFEVFEKYLKKIIVQTVEAVVNFNI
ncbi:quinone oxidoreductase-like protein 1 isoform X2 [Bos javanicus]|uniref:quinone oxidoreductase-like protein 1 isoform X2 n=1 Tax=Bos javanicus TaxID=9906 RepID=UPI002AA85D7D|nr:quinone oxidoreductase-like protein 1 isoform X2 [Bos javanicus]